MRMKCCIGIGGFVSFEFAHPHSEASTEFISLLFLFFRIVVYNMREEVIVRLRSLARSCQFDFKRVSVELITFCEVNHYSEDARLINESICREYFTKDYIRSTVPEDEKIIEAVKPPTTNIIIEEEEEEEEEEIERECNLPSEYGKGREDDCVDDKEGERSLGEEKEILFPPSMKPPLPFLHPSQIISIFDLIERPDFDQFISEIENELELQADPKSNGTPPSFFFIPHSSFLSSMAMCIGTITLQLSIFDCIVAFFVEESGLSELGEVLLYLEKEAASSSRRPSSSS